MINGACHCGAVAFELRTTPEWLTDCNCSICRRLGGLWAHVDVRDITIVCDGDATSRYIWGDKTIAFHSCKTCGCTTHWENLRPEESTRMAVNLRLADPEEIAGIRVRRLDGADSWAYLD